MNSAHPFRRFLIASSCLPLMTAATLQALEPVVFFANNTDDRIGRFSASEAAAVTVNTGSVTGDMDISSLNSYQLIFDGSSSGVSLNEVTAYGNHIFFNDFDGAIYRSDLDGTTTASIVAGRGEFVRSIAAGNNQIFWTEGNNSSAVHIYRANVDGTGITRVTSTADAYDFLETNDTGLYYSIDGFKVATRPFLNLSSESQVFSDPSASIRGMAVTNDLLFFSDGFGVPNTILEIDLQTTNLTTFYSNPAGTDLHELEFANDTVFFLDSPFSGERDMISVPFPNPSGQEVPLVDGSSLGPFRNLDDFAVVAVPEPRFSALVVGFIAAGLGLRVRRNRQKSG
ncbi:MAG: DUF5050 domain-containing protein [Opitutales bacterium]